MELWHAPEKSLVALRHRRDACSTAYAIDATLSNLMTQFTDFHSTQVLEHEDIGMMTIINITGVEGTTAYRDDYTANCGACYQDKDGPVGPDGTFPENGGRAYCTVADTIGQICQNVPGCEPDPDHDPFKYRERLGPASPPQTLPQPLPAPLNRRNLRFGYKEDVFCPEGCKPKED